MSSIISLATGVSCARERVTKGEHDGATETEGVSESLKPVYGQASAEDSEVVPPIDRNGKDLDVDFFRAQPDDSQVVRPVFPKTGPTTGIAEFYLNPPKSIPVVEGIRPCVKGKFIFVGDEKFYMRAITSAPSAPK